MSYYRPNPACSCGRCATRGLMSPAILITLGVLFLLENVKDFPFEHTWPILLIVIGAVRVVRYVVPDQGHVNPGQYPYPGPYGAPYGQYPGAVPYAAPAPATSAASSEPLPVKESEGNSGEVHNG